MSVSAVITAGGSGQRFGAKKQYCQLAGIPILQRTVSIFAAHPSVDQIVVVVPADELKLTAELLADFNVTITSGGPSRQTSVHNGLKLAAASDLVLIHDGVRPLVTAEVISRVLTDIDGYDGCIPALPVTDTIKMTADGVIQKTVPRDNLYTAQTPQAFITDSIITAHEQTKGEATDDSALIEERGGRVKITMGDPENIKVTHPEDIKRAEEILRWRSEPA